MLSINKKSYEIACLMEKEAESLNIAVEKLSCGATIIDAGVNVTGSYEAGRLFSEACMGGLGKVNFSSLNYGGLIIPSVIVTISQPVKSCMAAQYAGWFVKVDIDGQKSYQAMGSGPARSLYKKEPLLKKLDIAEESDVAVLILESNKLPGDKVATWVADKCGVSPNKVTILVAPTASIVGSVQIASRVVETGLHKMFEVGFDINCVVSGFGNCPIAPIAQDNMRAIGKTNDAVLYGGQAWYTVKSKPETVVDIIKQLPSSASQDYGTPFYDLFQRYECDFYKIDPLLFSPAEVYINELNSGRGYKAGKVNAEILKKACMV